jgi:MFS family permease
MADPETTGTADPRLPDPLPDPPLSEAAPARLGTAFWELWTSSSLSNLADGIFKVALPLVAVRLTHSPTLIAGLSLALTLPWLLFALPAGAIADRVDRRRAMVVAEVGRATLLVVLTVTVVTGTGSIWVLYAVALCIGVAETINDTSAQSILPLIVPRDRLSRANGRLFAAELTANQFIGPPLGGFLAAAGAAIAFGTPAALWAGAAAVLLLLRGSFRVEREGRSTMVADIAEGLRFLWHNRVLRTLAVMVGVFNFASNAAFAVFVLYAVGTTSAMGLTDPAYGVLLTTVAVGSLIGSLVAERLEQRLGRQRSLALTTVGSALLIGVPALTPNPFVIGAAFFIGGGTIAIWNVITVSLRQRITPDRILGRVNSGYRLLAWGSMPLGAAAGGLLAQALGLRAVFGAAALLALALLVVLRGITDEAMDAADVSADS